LWRCLLCERNQYGGNNSAWGLGRSPMIKTFSIPIDLLLLFPFTYLPIFMLNIFLAIFLYIYNLQQFLFVKTIFSILGGNEWTKSKNNFAMILIVIFFKKIRPRHWQPLCSNFVGNPSNSQWEWPF
jgi:hypothetical protein